ncbi:hypothetical protein RSAG8_06210, partial [Rhizoctonia solani AG-8 WAC10335]
MSQYPAGSYETQFEARSDDEENLYNVEKILAERGGRYLVQWEGVDPTTGEKWAPDWVPKTDCTDDLIADWKREKAAKKQKRGGTSVKSASSASGSVTVVGRSSKSRPESGKSMASRATEASSSTRSRSPLPLRKTTTSRRASAFYIELPVPRRTKRRRESDTKPEPMSPVKRMKLGGPASPLPASPFDNDDGEVGATFPKKSRTKDESQLWSRVLHFPNLPALTFETPTWRSHLVAGTLPTRSRPNVKRGRAGRTGGALVTQTRIRRQKMRASQPFLRNPG